MRYAFYAAMLLAMGLLSACQDLVAPSPPPKNSSPEAGAEVPAHVAQALAVVAAEREQGITPENAQEFRVVSTLVYTPEGDPAYWAHLVVRNPKARSFWEEVMRVSPDTPVYITGASKTSGFHGQDLAAGAFQELRLGCPACRPAYHPPARLLMGLLHGQMVGINGRPFGPQTIQAIREEYAALRRAIQESDLPGQIAQDWDKIISLSPSAAQLGLAGGTPDEPPAMNVGLHFYKPTALQGVKEECVSRFFGLCTVKRVHAKVMDNWERWPRAYDYGNLQPINAYYPLLEPTYKDASDNYKKSVWGQRDILFGNQLWVWRHDREGIMPVGCGPLALLRGLNWIRVEEPNTWGARTLIPPERSSVMPPVEPLTSANWAGPFNKLTYELPWGEKHVIEGGMDLLRLAFAPFPEPIGQTTLSNGEKVDVLEPWINRYLNTRGFKGIDVATMPIDFLNGGNAWLQAAGFRERLYGAAHRWDVASGLVQTLIPGVNLLLWTRATWDVNGVLRRSIGQDNRPALVLYTARFYENDEKANGYQKVGKTLHFAPAYEFESLEYWTMSANYAYIAPEDSKRRDPPIAIIGCEPKGNGSEEMSCRVVGYTNKVYLSDFMELTFGAFGLSR